MMTLQEIINSINSLPQKNGTIYLSFSGKKRRNLEGIIFGRDYKNLER